MKRKNIFGFQSARAPKRGELGWTPHQTKHARKMRALRREAKKHRYDWMEDLPSGGLSAVRSDVALALRGQGIPPKHAKKLARSASGSDFDSLFRSALQRVKGNPMSKKKSKKKKRNSRKGKMPAGLRKYWAKKRARKSNPKRRTRKKKNSRRHKSAGAQLKARLRALGLLPKKRKKNGRRKKAKSHNPKVRKFKCGRCKRFFRMAGNPRACPYCGVKFKR
jgi:rubrerythrin